MPTVVHHRQRANTDETEPRRWAVHARCVHRAPFTRQVCAIVHQQTHSDSDATSKHVGGSSRRSWKPTRVVLASKGVEVREGGKVALPSASEPSSLRLIPGPGASPSFSQSCTFQGSVSGFSTGARAVHLARRPRQRRTQQPSLPELRLPVSGPSSWPGGRKDVTESTISLPSPASVAWPCLPHPPGLSLWARPPVGLGICGPGSHGA